MTKHLSPLLLIVGFYIGGCASSPPLTLEVQNAASVRYERGVALLASQQKTVATVALLDATQQALLFDLALGNTSQTGFDITIDNIALELLPAEGSGGALAGTVFSYQALRASNDNALAWDSASIVTGAVIPSVVGGVGGAVARGFIGLGMNRAKQQDQANSKPPAENYFRRQTLDPGEYYAGVIKVGLPRTPAANDTLTLTVTTPLDSHRFSYTVKP